MLAPNVVLRKQFFRVPVARSIGYKASMTVLRNTPSRPQRLKDRNKRRFFTEGQKQI